MTPVARRTLATRNAAWAGALARTLASVQVQPNAVSVAGVLFATIAGAAFLVVPSGRANPVLALVVAAAAIQLRLLCNLLDGMLAVEQGLKTATGEIYNELPDRLSDVLILAGAGYSIPDVVAGPLLGWTAAVAALLTAYVRVLAGSLGATQHFIGPMAKPHRMFVLTVATLAFSVERLLGMPSRALPIGLAIIVAGSIATAWRRTRRLVREMEDR